MKRALLFIGGGAEAVPAFEKARKMGLSVVCFDGNAACPGFFFADAVEIIDTYDAERCADIASSKYPGLSGVLSVGADVPVSVASVGERLGLNTVSIEVAKCVSNKVLMKDAFSLANIAIPEYRSVSNSKAILDFMSAYGPRVVVKPTDSRGARGVVLLNDKLDAEWAFNQAREISSSGSVMVERFVSGPQFSTEGFVNMGRYIHVGTSNRNYSKLHQFKPYIIEDGGSLPASIDQEQMRSMVKLLGDVVSSLKMETGVLKGDLVWDETTECFRVIEVATRLSGGYFCTHEIPLSTGFDFIGEAIHQALGEPRISEMIVDERRSVCQRYVFGRPGTVRSIPDIAAIENMTGIELARCSVEVGDRLTDTTSHVSRLGVVIASGTSPREAQKNCLAAVDCMESSIEISSSE